jgi:hypothetical protein
MDAPDKYFDFSEKNPPDPEGDGNCGKWLFLRLPYISPARAFGAPLSSERRTR